MLIHRFRFVFRMTGHARLCVHQAAEIYALLAYANGMASGVESAMPDGLLLDAPEQGRLRLAPGDEFACGGTWLAGSPDEARGRLKRLVAALNEVGGTRGLPGAVLGNNFRVYQVEDLVTGQRWDGSQPLVPISSEHIQDEIARLSRHVAAGHSVQLRCVSPLRFHLPKGLRHTGHAFADESWFDPACFIDRAALRQQSLGIVHSSAEAKSTAQLQKNDLVWLDLSYGTAGNRKQLGGALGDVVISGVSATDIERLVWGQYVAVGDNTRFGFGRYRLSDLGVDPFECQRSTSLLSLAWHPIAIDQAGERYGVDSGACSHRVQEIQRGVYQSAPYHKVTIQSGSRSRELSIPDKVDRALQRVVHEFIAPALDQVFEESSLAFRKGLGRQTAARRLKQAVSEGFRWALRADIDDFFDRIDHASLEARLRAYLADPALTELLMHWTRTGSPEPQRGLPTGAVISPLLANLFLDQFDDHIARAGGRLVRYADDFLILYRTEAEARAAYQVAVDAANALHLQLNQDKTAILDLHEPFTFVGFRFERNLRVVAPNPPCTIDQLGWFDVGSQRDMQASEIQLPYESIGTSDVDRATLILGPGLKWLGYREGQLQYGYGEHHTVSGSTPIDRLEHVLVLGSPSLHHELIREIGAHALQITVLDDWCRPQARLMSDNRASPGELLLAQCEFVKDAERCLDFARKLIVAKIRNYATLADATPGRKRDLATGAQLRDYAQSAAQASSLPALLGIEGAAAALWFGRVSERLPTEFSFEKRVAPHAQDPINILMNIAQTLLHRLITALIEASGLSPYLGVMHQPRSGHASLASDLQEPFRPLMDRVVLEAARQLLPSDFTHERSRRVSDPNHDEPSPFLRLRPAAARRFIERVHRILTLNVIAQSTTDRAPYRLQIARQIRSFKHSLLHPESAPRVFEYASNVLG